MGSGGIEEATWNFIRLTVSFVGLLLFFVGGILLFAYASGFFQSVGGSVFLLIATCFTIWLVYECRRILANPVRTREEAEAAGELPESPEIERPLPELPEPDSQLSKIWWLSRFFKKSGSSGNTGESRRLAASGSQEDASCGIEVDPQLIHQGAGPSGVGPDVEYRSDESTMKDIPSISADDSRRTTPSSEMEVSDFSLDGSEKRIVDVIAPDSSSVSSKIKSNLSKHTTPSDEMGGSAALPKSALDGSEKQAAEVPKQDSHSPSSESKSKGIPSKHTAASGKMEGSALPKSALDGSEKQAAEVPKQDSTSPSSKSKSKDILSKHTTPSGKAEGSALPKLALEGSEKQAAEVPKLDSTSPSSKSKSKDILSKRTTPSGQTEGSALPESALDQSEKQAAEVPKQDSTSPSSKNKSD